MKDIRCHGLLPESVELFSPSQAGGFSGHQGAVSSVANQMKEKTGVLQHWRRWLPSWAEGVTKARLMPFSRQESLPMTHLLTQQGGHVTVEGFLA
jgi:hypothetical protein